MACLQATCPVQYKAKRWKRISTGMKSQRREEATLERATEAYLAILRADPTDARAYVSLGTIYQKHGRLAEAEQILAEGCAIAEGNNAHIWTAMANLEKEVRSALLPWRRACLSVGSPALARIGRRHAGFCISAGLPVLARMSS